MAELEETPQLNWSASYTVGAASQATAKDLQGDKILLPQSALEQLLSASTRTGPSTSHTFTAFDPSNPYSVAAARQERSRFQESFQQLPHPLMFRLVNQNNGNTIYAGIREFSADEGQAVLSPYLLEALGIQQEELKSGSIQRDADDVVDLTAEDDEGVRITVKAHQLPKGVYVRLRPLEAGYNPDDWKSLLERQLRASYTTLTKDALLLVRGVRGEEFRFLIDKFQPDGDGICVVDTDLEVDIEALNEEQARETLRQIAERSQSAPGTSGGSSVGQTIDIWNDVEAQVLPGDYVDYDLPSWDRSRPIVIELSDIQDGQEIDLFVSPKSERQRALPRDSEHVFGDFSSPNGSKQIVIQPSNVQLEGADALLISVHGYALPDDNNTDRTPRRYKLRVRAGDAQGSAVAPIEVEQSVEHSSDEEPCTNCLQWIPKRTILLHENFCRRNNILCPQCKGVFLKSSTEWAEHWHCPEHPASFGSTSLSKAKHNHIHHGQHTCPACGPSSPFTYGSLPLLAQHRTTTCPHKLILCRFCHLEVPQEGDPLDPSSEAETVLTGLTAHERADGARTTDCHLCGAIVRLRDMAAHMAHHELDKAQRAAVPPPICRNALCSRTLHGVGPRGQVGAGTRMGQGPGNELGLCSLCFGPLYVSMYDPEGKALRRRVERRYLTQLMKGCGRAGCLNEWCRSGRKHLGLEEMGTSASAALPLVKPLLDALGNSTEEMHFCVDEATQKRRKLAEMLAAEGVWDLEWCIAALEAEGGDLIKARGWLGDWAPMKTQR